MSKIATPEASSAFSECIHDNYNKCFEYSGSPRAIKTIFPGHGRVEQARSASLEILARLRIWGDESKAELPAVSRGSLDDILRNEPKMKRTVIRILKRLQKNLAICAQFEETQSASETAKDPENDSSDSEESEVEGITKLPTNSAIIRQMNQDLGSLLQVSLLVRQPGYERRYIHSTGLSQSSSTFAQFAELDLRHVAEKFRSWRSDCKVLLGQENTATATSIEERKILDEFSDAHVALIHRLAKANTKRREQLLYWARHPDQSYRAIDRVQADAPAPVPTKQDPMRDNMTQQDLTAIPSPTPKDRPREPSESVRTRDTFSVRLESEANGTSNASSSTPVQYERSVLGIRRTNQVPKLPKVAPQALSFECRYCRGIIPLRRVNRREDWKRHVLKDLRAYVCTYPDCQNPDKQYSTQQDWFNHEKQVHRRQWFCGQHNEVFDSPELLLQHVNQFHAAAMPQEQMSHFVMLSERATDRDTDTPCPLCPEIRPLAELEGHLAEHLQSIALFVAGAENDDDDSKTDRSQSTAGSKTSSWLLSNPSNFIPGSQGLPSMIQSVGNGSEDGSDFSIHSVNVEKRSSSEASVTMKLSPTSQDIVMAVMGSIGVGKTMFISYVSDRVRHMNHGLEEPTTEVEAHICTLPDGSKLFLVEIPAMEGIVGLDTNFLNTVSWFCTAHEQNIRLAGVIYLQPISQSRSVVLSLRILEKLVGKEHAGHIVIATTFWQEIPPDTALAREKELERTYWKRLIEKGSTIMRQDRGKESACEIIQCLMNRRERPVLALQREFVDEGLDLIQTGVGTELQNELDLEGMSYRNQLEQLKHKTEKESSSITEVTRSGNSDLLNLRRAYAEELEDKLREIEGDSRKLQVKWNTLKHRMTSPERNEKTKKEGYDERAMVMQDNHEEVFDDSHGTTNYQNVAVLILRWDNAEFRVGEDHEIARLKRVLGDRFNFDVRPEILLSTGVGEVPQTAINTAIIGHIDRFDGPNNLLIIYYAGGSAFAETMSGQGEMMLIPSPHEFDTYIGGSLPFVQWSPAERPLIQDTEGDVLTILDCCLDHNTRPEGSQATVNAYDVTSQTTGSYELMVASDRDGHTPPTNKYSLTTPLLNTLEELLERPGTPRPIQMAYLVELLNQNSRDGDIPQLVILFERPRYHKGSSIQLTPMRQRPQQGIRQPSKTRMTVSERRRLRARQRWATALDYASGARNSKDHQLPTPDAKDAKREQVTQVIRSLDARK